MSAAVTPYILPDDESTTRDGIEKRFEELQDAINSPMPHLRTRNRLHALLIGVDKYFNEEDNLSGAVRDARRVEALLLGLVPPVSDENITVLENACDQDIIDHIRRLRTNPFIKKDDPILIYYAGHGSSLPRPPGWPTRSQHIQCLSPSNARVEDGKVVGVITDRAFGALLQDLAKAKGDNITVILDSCHSGSATRTGPNTRSLRRGIDFRDKRSGEKYTVGPTYHGHIWNGFEGQPDRKDSSRALADLPVFSYGGLQSHIVLAACGPNEFAFEDFTIGESEVPVCEGRFTSALLRELKATGPDTITYTELIRRLGNISSQTPQCEGHEKDRRILFKTALKQGNRPYYSVYRIEAGFILNAGQVNGVAVDDVYAVYATSDALARQSEPPLGELMVTEVRPVSSKTIVKSDLHMLDDHPSAVAVLSRVGRRKALPLHVHPQLKSIAAEALAKEVAQFSRDPEYTFVLSSLDTAVFSIVPVGKSAIGFDILDKRMTDHGLHRLDATVDRDVTKLQVVLRAAAHFFYHLNSAPPKPGLRRQISGSIQELSYEFDFDGSGVPRTSWQVTGQPVDLHSPDRGAFYPKVAVPGASHEDRTWYGVTVANRQPGEGVNVYLWMFYFDCRTLEIRSFFQPPAGRVEPSLQAASSIDVPLNYGDAGSLPLTFDLPKERKLDIGFLRIFVSSQIADLSNIAQKPAIGGRVMAQSTLIPPAPAAWDAITIAVVQHREADDVTAIDAVPDPHDVPKTDLREERPSRWAWDPLKTAKGYLGL
ncbi:unnamed protein product [Peniophora sp. CBMAI 1063]|nr:unnamed protein product [Peniophora sp. CBMAI 1063]